MQQGRPLILISNDDGVTAKGLAELVKFLRPLGNLVVMAPDSPRSGSGCAMSVTSPVKYQLVKQEVGLKVYKCSGTPTDCIKLARHTILEQEPDLVVGGINHGDNSAVNVHYSGTMGIVIEGCLNGIPSIGFSLCDHASNADFTQAGPYIRKIAADVLTQGLPPLTCLNVNIPVGESLKGIKVCTQAKGRWINEWETCSRRNGQVYYWLTGEFEHSQDADHSWDDFQALQAGYVSITPTTVDVTAYNAIETLKKIYEDWQP